MRLPEASHFVSIKRKQVPEFRRNQHFDNVRNVMSMDKEEAEQFIKKNKLKTIIPESHQKKITSKITERNKVLRAYMKATGTSLPEASSDIKMIMSKDGITLAELYKQIQEG